MAPGGHTFWKVLHSYHIGKRRRRDGDNTADAEASLPPCTSAELLEGTTLSEDPKQIPFEIKEKLVSCESVPNP